MSSLWLSGCFGGLAGLTGRAPDDLAPVGGVTGRRSRSQSRFLFVSFSLFLTPHPVWLLFWQLSHVFSPPCHVFLFQSSSLASLSSLFSHHGPSLLHGPSDDPSPLHGPSPLGGGHPLSCFVFGAWRLLPCHLAS